MHENATQRRQRLQRKLKSLGVDALLVTNPTNVTYLTGFTGEDSHLLVGREQDLLVSDSRFTVQLQEECPALDVEIRHRTTPLPKAVAHCIKKMCCSSLGLEAHSATLFLQSRLSDLLPQVTFVPLDDAVEQLREIKDKEEITAIRRAIRQAELALGVVRAAMLPGNTECQIAADIEHQIRRFGGKGCSFEPIVAVGPRAALPHASPTPRAMGESDFVLIDWGACERLYISDLTRLFVTGRISPKLERIYGLVLTAQRRAIESIKPGISMGAVDSAARSVIEEAGFGKNFGHGLGHGIGLEVHEAPRLADKAQRLLEPGMVVTVEPGIYLPGWGGVRIEDDILVTKDGHEVLSGMPTELEDCVVAGA